MRPIIAVLLLVPAFAGCLSEDGLTGLFDEEYEKVEGSLYSGSHPSFGFPTYGFDDASHAAFSDDWQPPAKRDLPSELGRLTHVATTGLSSGAGIALFGHYAYVGGTGGPLNVVDIADPTNPNVVATANIPMRDAETIAYPDGSLLLVSTDGGEVSLTDVTNPRSPTLVGNLQVTNGAHNVAVLPGTPLFYNSPSGGTVTDIWDLSDPTDPIMVQQWENGAGCHDIMWYINNDEGKYRGYCAGLGVTQIWDITDAYNPLVIADFPIPDFIEGTPVDWGAQDPRISHLAMVNHDATILIVGDETGGGASVCDAYVEEPVTGTTESGPIGNLWFYDLADEENPEFVSQLSPSLWDSHAMCTSHFGRIVEDTNHLVIAFYGAGVILVDFNDINNPRIVDKWRAVSADAAPPGIAWDAWYYQGYVFTGDITRGMDILQIDAPLI